VEQQNKQGSSVWIRAWNRIKSIMMAAGKRLAHAARVIATFFKATFLACASFFKKIMRAIKKIILGACAGIAALFKKAGGKEKRTMKEPDPKKPVSGRGKDPRPHAGEGASASTDTMVFTKEDLLRAKQANAGPEPAEAGLEKKADKKGFFAPVAAWFHKDSTRTIKAVKRKGRGKRTEHAPLFVPRTKKPNILISILVNVCRLSVVAVLLAGVILLGGVFGIAKAYTESAPELDLKRIEDQAETSFIYDGNGKLITTFTGIENREWAEIKEIPETLQNAFIAIEDVRFRTHNGVDIKRLAGAFVSNFMNESIQGGSTITQQLIKQRVLTSERTYKRKLQEAYLAYELESKYTKDEILEAYMNTIHLGESNYGVKAAAQDYFGKHLEELTLLECAVLAGATQNPNTYNPRKNFYEREKPELTLNRAYKVLENMFRAGFITEQQYISALNEKLQVLEEPFQSKEYDLMLAYFVDYAISDVIQNLIEQRGLPDNSQNRSAIENELRTKGYHIYLTVDPDLQMLVQNTLTEWERYPALQDASKGVYKTTNPDGTITETEQPQAAAAVYDYHTGELKAIVGGRDIPKGQKEFNRASQSTMPVGSSIKPIGVYGPALDKGYGAGTIQYNIPVPIPDWDAELGYPVGQLGFKGPVSIRRAVTNSMNVVAARTLMDFVGVEDSAVYLESLGIDPEHISHTGSGQALGSDGITPVEMTVAFGAIANEGEYLKAVAFSKVLDKSGETVIDKQMCQTKRQVFKKSSAYMLNSMLEDAVAYGTGTRCQIPGMHVAGKTGTSSNYRGTFFSGYTPYYAASVWIGHDNYEPLAAGTEAAMASSPLWQSFMAKIHEELEDRPIYDGTPEDYGVVQVTVCGLSGKLATSACTHDAAGFGPVTDFFAKGSEPIAYCDMHRTAVFCTESNMHVSEYCPEEFHEERGTLQPSANSSMRESDLNYLLGLYDEKIAEAAQGDEQNPDANARRKECDIHTAEWAHEKQEREDAVHYAESMIEVANQFIENNEEVLKQKQVKAIRNAIKAVRAACEDEEAAPDVILQAVEDLSGLLVV
jgi:penicillin-binding protein 1A